MSELTLRFHNSAMQADYVMRTFRTPELKLQFLDTRWPTLREIDGNALGHPVSMIDIDDLPEGAERDGFILDETEAWRVSAAGMRACLHAIRAAGMHPEPDEAVSGYLLVSAEPTLFGLHLQPAYAPQPEGGSDARSWFETYGAHRTQEAAEKEVADDQRSMILAHEEGDLEDVAEPDIVMPVRIYPDGSMELLEFSSVDPATDLVARYKAEEVYQAFGMEKPEPGDTPEL